MCGIAGQFNFEDLEPVEPDAIWRMARAIAHRGPDDEGFFFDGALGLGFRRLSIIDLAGGHQPMSDADGSVWVVFNGEIYNFKELRHELEQHGHIFRTQCDTEVIVHGYKQWGDGVLGKLNGMFGLAVWDVRRKRLVIARDAMGIKLVYYRVAHGRMTFGSEIRALLACDTAIPPVDATALERFLTFRYTPSPLTMFEGVRKLAPGTMLVVEPGACREARWYDYTPVPLPDNTDPEAAAEELLELYRAAVQRHLLSDVPLGILLSGGLDSGLLLALMRDHGREWPAYTVGYGDSFADDELADARDSAALLGGLHIPVQLDRREFERALPAIVASLEEPITSSSIVPMYFVSRRARQDVKVALIGQGPDELFCGYKRHVGVRYGDAWRKLPRPLQRAIGSAVRRLPRNEAAKRGVYALGVDDPLARFEHVFALAPVERIGRLFRGGPPARIGRRVESWAALLPEIEHLDELAAFQHIEIRSSLPDELLMFADKLSMAHSLEVRVPYLDRTVVEFAERLPASLKMRRGRGKWLHRQVCRRYLPPPLLKRKKRGFAVNVVDQWLKSATTGMLPELLLDRRSLMFDLLEPEPVRRLLEDHRAGKDNNYKLLFSLAMFEQWLRGISARRPVPVEANQQPAPAASAGRHRWA
jgi:asparagine synthase (glutamine-hydrolysing)